MNRYRVLAGEPFEILESCDDEEEAIARAVAFERETDIPTAVYDILEDRYLDEELEEALGA